MIGDDDIPTGATRPPDQKKILDEAILAVRRARTSLLAAEDLFRKDRRYLDALGCNTARGYLERILQELGIPPALAGGSPEQDPRHGAG